MSKVITYSNRHGRVYQAEQHPLFDRLNNSGIYQITNLRFMRDLVPNAGTIIDIGAHAGTSCMEYATWAKNVEAFEAYPATYELLVSNIRHNRKLPEGKPWYNKASTKITAKINTYNVALMDQNADAFITHRAEGLASFVRFDRGEIAIEATTLDSYNFDNVDAVKIDTEGTEWLIIQGGRETIEKHRPVVQVEMWGWERRFGLNNQDLLDYFRSLNYDQVDCLGRSMPWDYAGPYRKAMGNGKSAMDRFFIPK